MDITLWKEVMITSYYGLYNLAKGWRQRWSEISILGSVGKCHFEDPDVEKDCHCNRIPRNYYKENHKALGEVPGGSSVG